MLNLVNLVQLLRRCCKNKSWVLNLGDVSTLFKYKYYTTTAARRTRWWRWRCSCSWWRWWRAGSPPPKHQTQNPLRQLLPPTAQPSAIAATENREPDQPKTRQNRREPAYHAPTIPTPTPQKSTPGCAQKANQGAIGKSRNRNKG